MFGARCSTDSSTAVGSRQQPIVATLVLLTAIGCGACGRDDPGDPSTDSATTNTAAGDVGGPQHSVETTSSDRLPRIDPAAIGLDAQSSDPGAERDGWDSEAASAAVDAQLESLGKLLAHPKTINAGQLEKLVTADVRCGPLRPAKLQTVMDDSSLIVRRWSKNDSDSLDPIKLHLGPRGFAEALAELVKPLASAGKIRTKFKVVRVEIAEETIRTSVVYQAAGLSKTAAAQQTARWQCEWRRDGGNKPRLESVTVVEYEEAISRSQRGVQFVDCTEAVLGANTSYQKQLIHGIGHWLGRIDYQRLNDNGAYQGLAIGDVNGDGLEDLYVLQPGGLPNRLFVQQADGTALDTSAAAGVDWWSHCHAALFVDLDNDGDQDLVIGTTHGLIFMANDGQGKFTTAASQLTPSGVVYSLCAADFDMDGDLDIYACCYTPAQEHIKGNLMARPMPFQDAQNGGRNVLFRNEQNWRFRDVTRQVGLDANNHRFSYAAAWEDYDNDGDLDLYVANDYGRNHLYENNGQGHFTDVAARAGVEDMATGMSVSWADYNRDGWMDLYVSNMWSSAGNRVMYQSRFLSDTDQSTLGVFRRYVRGNSLFSNTGAGTFTDVSLETGVTLGRWAWSSNFADINNDGWEDLIVTNGFITQEDTGDL